MYKRQVTGVLEGKITEAELEAAKSYALGRHQMGAQTAGQISNFYTNRYFADGVVKDYEKVPDAIRAISRDLMVATARSFVAHGTWAFAGVSSQDKHELVELGEKLETLFLSLIHI